MNFKFHRDRVFSPVGLRRMSGQTADSVESESVVSHRGIMQIIILFCSLEILDAIITYSAVKGGLVWEGNVLTAQIAGNWGFIIIKVVGALLSGLILQKLYEHFPKLSWAAAISITVFYGVVLAWNAGMIIHILLAG